MAGAAREVKMNVSGEAAAAYDAVRLDSFENANKGPLVSADTDTGVVVYKDVTGEEKTVELGPHALRLVRRR